MLPLSTNIFTGVEEGITSALIVEAWMKKGIIPLKYERGRSGVSNIKPKYKRTL